MSNKTQSSGEDYPAAAIKHLDDAVELLARNRHDGAAYLSGYCVECVLKTLMQVELGNKDPIIKHDLSLLDWRALNLATLPGAKTWRYVRQMPISSIPYGTPPQGWKETLRYYPPGTISASQAASWVTEARRLRIEVIGEMEKDGEVVI